MPFVAADGLGAEVDDRVLVDVPDGIYDSASDVYLLMQDSAAELLLPDGVLDEEDGCFGCEVALGVLMMVCCMRGRPLWMSYALVTRQSWMRARFG